MGKKNKSKSKKKILAEQDKSATEGEKKKMSHNNSKDEDLKCEDLKPSNQKKFPKFNSGNKTIYKKTVSCDFACGKYFETEENMTNHMKKVHKW